MLIRNLIEYIFFLIQANIYEIAIETKRNAWSVVIAVNIAVHQLHRKRRLHFVIEYVDATDTLLHNSTIDL